MARYALTDNELKTIQSLIIYSPARGKEADKGYDARRIRKYCRRHGLVPMIPKRRNKQGKQQRNRNFDKDMYKKRNVVERCLLWLKECRRVATRF